MSMKVAQVPGGLTPAAACLCLVISAVFIAVQKPTGDLCQCCPCSGAKRTGSVGLGHAAAHSAEEAGRGWREAVVDGNGGEFGCGEEKDGAF
jgi:hypothetical protein